MIVELKITSQDKRIKKLKNNESLMLKIFNLIDKELKK